MDFIDDYKNNVYEWTFENPLSQKSRCGIFRADKGGSFNLVLKNIERYQFKVSNNKEESGVVFCEPYE